MHRRARAAHAAPAAGAGSWRCIGSTEAHHRGKQISLSSGSVNVLRVYESAVFSGSTETGNRRGLAALCLMTQVRAAQGPTIVGMQAYGLGIRVCQQTAVMTSCNCNYIHVNAAAAGGGAPAWLPAVLLSH
jgi:hypothetical protein